MAGPQSRDVLAMKIPIPSTQAQSKWCSCENCLVPLLREMRWQGNDRLLFEALPHFDRIESFQDLRVVLNRLQVVTTPLRGSVSDLGQAQFPCLCVLQGDVHVVAGKTETGDFRAFSGAQGQAGVLTVAEVQQGDIYLVHEDDEEDSQVQSSRSWFSSVSKRFRSSVLAILALGFVLNLLALGPPLFIMAIYDKAMGAKSIDVLLTMAAGIAVILITEIALRKTKTWLQSYLGGRVDAIVGNRTFERILHLPYSMLSEAPIGTQVMRLRYFDSVRDIFQSSLFNALVDIPFTLIFITAIFLIGGPGCAAAAGSACHLRPNGRLRFAEGSKRSGRGRRAEIETQQFHDRNLP